MPRSPLNAPPPPLTQLDLQDAIVSLLRVAVVWGRRSFEVDKAPDRGEDQAFLKKIVDAISEYMGSSRTLVRAPGKTKTAFREDSFRLLELYEHVYLLTRDFRRSSRTADASMQFRNRVVEALRTHGFPASAQRVNRDFSLLRMNEASTRTVNAILQLAELPGYRTLSELKRAIAKAQQIRARREVEEIELIEYFLACLQVPKDYLHALAYALWKVRNGGSLSAVPLNPFRRSPITGRFPPKRIPYERYGAAMRWNDTVAVLDNDHQPDLDDDPPDVEGDEED